MTALKPSIGRIVVAKGVVKSNGTDEHPAIVNRAWGNPVKTPTGIDYEYVNLTVFPDFMTPQHAGSVAFFRSKSDADQAIEQGQTGPVAYWPERV